MVTVDGIEAGKTPVAQLCGHVGLVFQNPFNQLSGAKDNVYEEVAFGMQNLGVPAEEMKKRVEEALKLLDIWQYRDRNPFDLSGGQMQRVAIASVLVMRPDVMILDEPTSQLDPEGSDEVFRAVETLTGSGITILMIEQKIEKLAAYCDRTLAITAPEELRVKRIMAREGISEDYARMRVADQKPSAWFQAHCDDTLESTETDTVETFAQRARALFQQMLEESK